MEYYIITYNKLNTRVLKVNKTYVKTQNKEFGLFYISKYTVSVHYCTSRILLNILNINL